MSMKNYKVYIHKLKDGRVYIGKTCKDVNKRWNNGYAYRANKKFCCKIDGSVILFLR